LCQNCDRPIGVKDLAAVAGMSRRAFYSAFTGSAGRSPGEALHRVRIEHARRRFAEGEHKTEDLARMGGCRGVTGFWITFKQATGRSSRQFREALDS
jgi:transcriptional regulator GlxA family with amidase domain